MPDGSMENDRKSDSWIAASRTESTCARGLCFIDFAEGEEMALQLSFQALTVDLWDDFVSLFGERVELR